MKIIFVDAENIGLKELEKIEALIVDKVFVFSRVEKIKQTCEKLLYLCLSDYPEGANQADFHIIANLSRTLASLSRKELNLITFQLFTNDENLISAFEFQCTLLGGNCEAIRTKSDVVVPIAAKTAPKAVPKTAPKAAPKTVPKAVQTAEHKIYNSLKKPTELGPLQGKLGLSKQTFTKAVNSLVKEDKIERSTESKKKWVQSR